jgi:hypothetical protein
MPPLIHAGEAGLGDEKPHSRDMATDCYHPMATLFLPTVRQMPGNIPICGRTVLPVANRNVGGYAYGPSCLVQAGRANEKGIAMRVAPSPDTDIRELFDGLDLGAEYRVELIDDRISVRSDISLRRYLIQAWLAYQLRYVVEVAGWMGLGIQGPVVLPSGDRIRPDLTVVRRGHLSASGTDSKHVRLVGEIVAGDDEYEAEEITRERCSLAGIPFYLRIDAEATPATITLYTRPQDDEYQGMTRVVAGDDLHLPDPFGIALDTATLPLG